MKDLITEQGSDVQMRALIDGLWRSADFGAVFEKAVHRDVVLHGGEAEYKGRLAVATSALAPMVACPDRHVICEDIVSHKLADGRDIGAARIRVSGRHAGGGVWGAPTGRDISYSVMVETTVREDRITDIWRVRDTGAVLAALDVPPESGPMTCWLRDCPTMWSSPMRRSRITGQRQGTTAIGPMSGQICWGVRWKGLSSCSISNTTQAPRWSMQAA